MRLSNNHMIILILLLLFVGYTYGWFNQSFTYNVYDNIGECREARNLYLGSNPTNYAGECELNGFKYVFKSEDVALDCSVDECGYLYGQLCSDDSDCPDGITCSYNEFGAFKSCDALFVPEGEDFEGSNAYEDYDVVTNEELNFITNVVVNKCDDGTLVNTCSEKNVGKWCDKEFGLIPGADRCDCPDGEVIDPYINRLCIDGSSVCEVKVDKGTEINGYVLEKDTVVSYPVGSVECAGMNLSKNINYLLFFTLVLIGLIALYFLVVKKR